MQNQVKRKAKRLNEFFEKVKIKEADYQHYPQVISFDQRGYETSVKSFLNVVKMTISHIRPLYNALQLSEPFDDETWKLMCINSNLVANRFADKLKLVAETIDDTMSIAMGITRQDILNRKHPNVNAIAVAMQQLVISLGSYYDNNKGHLSPGDVININTNPILNEDANVNHINLYRASVKNQREATIKATFDKFAQSYSELTQLLNDCGYGSHVRPLTNTYLGNFFDQADDFNLTTNPSAWSFLSNFKR